MVDIEPRLFRALRFTKGLSSIGFRQLMNEQEKCLNCDFYDLMIAMKKRKKRNESFFHTLEEKINHPNQVQQVNHSLDNLI
jgi:hypothetical protein